MRAPLSPEEFAAMLSSGTVTVSDSLRLLTSYQDVIAVCDRIARERDDAQRALESARFDLGEITLVLESQDRRLKRYRDALTTISALGHTEDEDCATCEAEGVLQASGTPPKPRCTEW